MSEFQLLIDGQLVPGAQTLPVINPASAEVFAHAPRASVAQLETAVAAAKAAFPDWAATPMEERGQRLNQIADVLQAHAEELAGLLSTEQGKPFGDAMSEVYGSIYFTRYFASLGLPARVAEDSSTRRAEVHRRPLGVVAAIAPWNYPLVLLFLKLPAALAAGNTLIVKPAPTTPLTTLRLAALIKDVLPRGVLNVITDANELGEHLTAHPDIRKISFTGSTVTGRKVMASAAQTLKRVTLEMGGNDAAIVLDDADPKAIAQALFNSAFQNSGQLCYAIKRLYVHESLYDTLADELAMIARSTIVGEGTAPDSKLGPLQNKVQFEKVQGYLEDARRDGKIIAGGTVIDRPGYFIEPTIVRDIQEGSRLVDEEQFGPILPMIKFSDVDDAIRRANDSVYGLGASIWSSDPQRALTLAPRMEAGVVWINKHMDVAPHIPFCGCKQSGYGVECAEEGLLEFTQLQIINGPSV